MIIGYVFDYEDKEEKDSNNKPVIHTVFDSSKKVLKEQRRTFIKDGYKCSKIMECIEKGVTQCNH